MKEKQALGQEMGTVVFIDIVGFSRMVIDSQVVVLSNFFKKVKRSADVNGVSRLLTLGDGMALLFPTPTQAVNFAVRIHEDIREIKINDSTRDELRIRVGVATGQVVTFEDTIVGSTVNFAQRIMARAEAGQTLCDEATKILSSEFLSRQSNNIQTLSVGTLSLKHMAGQLPVYSLSASESLKKT